MIMLRMIQGMGSVTTYDACVNACAYTPAGPPSNEMYAACVQGCGTAPATPASDFNWPAALAGGAALVFVLTMLAKKGTPT